MQSLIESHAHVIKQILCYLKGTTLFGIKYKRGNDMRLMGYSSHNVDIDDGWGTTGHVFYLGTSPITWFSQKQTTVALSLCEAEFMTATAATCQAIWLREILAEVTGMERQQVIIRVDNKSAIALSKNSIFHGRSKHIHTQYHFIRKCVENEKVIVEHVSGENQREDPLMKALARIRFKEMRLLLGVQELPSLTQDFRGMAPSGSDALFFNAHHDDVFLLNLLRYEHGLVYDWKLYKNKKMDYNIGLEIIERDFDVAAMYEFADAYGKLNMFMIHIHQNLAKFYFQNLNNEESGDEATSRLRIHEIMVKDATNMFVDELISWAEEEAQTQTLKKKVVEHVVDDEDIPLVNLVESPIFKCNLLGRNNPSPIAKRKLMGKVNPTSYVVNKGRSVLDEGSDNGKSIMVEDANTVKKVVDKGKSIMVKEDCPVHLPVRRNNGIVIQDNVNPSVVKSDTDSENELIELRKRTSEAKNAPKHEGFMDDLMRKLSQDNGMNDPFHIVESKVEKYHIHDVDTYWRMQKPKVGENSNTIVITKCGLRPEKIKNPELGKQSKFKRYPTEADRSNYRWRCYGKKMTTEDPVQVILMNDKHTCVKKFKYGTLVSYKWIGRHFGTKLRLNPDIKLHEIAYLVLKKYKCIVSPNQCRNAKRWALNEGETTIEDHYGYNRSYAKAILESNPCSTIKGMIEGEEVRQLFWDASKVTYPGMFWHVIPTGGHLFEVRNRSEAFGVDQQQSNDLEIPTSNGLTLMLDQHKGLIEGEEVMPHAEHRQCARHIYEWFRKQFSLDNCFGLLQRLPILECTNCEVVENRFSECFKSVILSVRSKPLITMLEAIRVIVLERMHTMRKLCDKWITDICPNIQKRLEITKDQHRFWHVIPTGGHLFEVRNRSEAFGVDQQQIIFKINRLVEDYVPDCFRKQAFHDTYHQYLTPVGGMTFWPIGSDMSRVLPPKPKTMPGSTVKGLIEGEEVMPHAEHRQRARHRGFRKQFSGVEFRQLFWAASKATYLGMSKPLITMLQAMRVIVLERMHIMRKLCDKWTTDICPNIQNRLEITKDQHRFWHIIPTGGHLFEVRNGLVEDYVPDCFRKQAFHDTYHQYLTPVGEMTFWPNYSDMSRVLPPKPKTMPGRLKKKRIRAAHENKNPNKVSKAGVTMTCINCHKKGHNKKGCKNATVVLPPKPPCKKGRPRKTSVVGSSLIDEDIDTHVVEEQVVQEQVVEEQASDFDVEGSTENDVSGSRESDVGGSRQSNVGGFSDVRGCNQFGLRRGRRVKTTVRRGGQDTQEDSEVALETNQNAETSSFAATQDTLDFSGTAFATT
ncbi:hypothetical protein Tco_0105385 [Tanacetum coccineum]